MLSPSDTAYPMLKAHPSAHELQEIFTPTLFELAFAEQHAREPIPCVGLLVCLKTFQRLGYFVKTRDVPDSILRSIAKAAGYLEIPEGFTRQRVSESEAGVPAEIRVNEIVEAALRRRGAARFSREQDWRQCVSL